MAEFPDKRIEITDSTFEESKKKYPLFILDCWAARCPPCRIMIPIVEKLVEEHKGKVVFGELDVDKNMAVPTKYGIMSIPTFLVFKNGELIDKMVGAMPYEALNSKIKNYLE
ncbi:MAG: thioredoxin domain-containing protein [Candidatus Aenigmatarchaeota archaeon]